MLLPSQEAFVKASNPYPALVAGFGSGKTAAGIARALALKIDDPSCDVAYYLPTYPLVEDIALRRFPDLCERKGWKYKLRAGSNPQIDFEEFGRIIFRSMENPDRIIGYEVGHSLVDELDTMPKAKASDAWVKIIARNRQKTKRPNSVGVTTTPEGFGFVHDRWVKNQAEGYSIIHAKTMDNPHLPNDYVQNLRNSYPEQLLDAYLNGQFVNLTSGSIYRSFNRVVHHTDAVVKTGEPLHIGIDFNVGNMAGVVANDTGEAVDELVGYLDTDALCRAIKDRYQNHVIIAYPDASGRNTSSKGHQLSDLTIMKQFGFIIRVNNTNPAVRDRINCVNVGFESGARVNTRKCPLLTEALERQAYDKNGEPDKTSGFDHVNDAYGYQRIYRFPVRVQRSGGAIWVR